MAHHLHITKKELRHVIDDAQRTAEAACDKMSAVTRCESHCRAGALVAIGKFSQAIEGHGRIMSGKVTKLAGGKLGIIVSPMEDCPKGFEEIIVRGGKNARVKVCRLDEKHRKKYAPPGKPARIGPLRRKTRPKYLPGVTTRDIKEAD